MSYTLSSYIHPSISNVVCPGSPIEDQSFVAYKCDSGSGTHSFTSCSWNNNGLSSNGGASHLIYTSPHPSISLTVNQSTFLHCHETGAVDGGAIYVKDINTASVSNSFFYDCECGSNIGHEGGGLCYAYLSSNPSIVRCTFIYCVSADDGGGCAIWHSQSQTSNAVDSIHCINFKGLSETGSEGGGIYIYGNNKYITCTNCLFAECSTKYVGGALVLSKSAATTEPLMFCFFHNSATKYGNDIFYYYSPTLTTYILYSLSTSPPHRICYVLKESDWTTPQQFKYDDDWLPQANINAKLTSSDWSHTYNDGYYYIRA